MQNQQVQLPEAAELTALYAKRHDYAQQLEVLTSRRGQLADQIARTEGGLRAEPQNRLAQLDERIARIEKEALQTDDRISALLNRGVTANGEPTPGIPEIPAIPPLPPIEFTESPFLHDHPGMRQIILGEAVGFLVLTAILCRWTWVRAKRRFASLTPRNDAQLQQAVDAIAIEVERISEGQRFVTAILSHRLGDARDARPGVQPPSPPKGRVVTPV